MKENEMGRKKRKGAQEQEQHTDIRSDRRRCGRAITTHSPAAAAGGGLDGDQCLMCASWASKEQEAGGKEQGAGSKKQGAGARGEWQGAMG